MESIRNSAKAVIIQDGCILTLKCAVNGEIFYQLPGGGQKLGETLTDALKRECMEEISADVEVGEILFIREQIGTRFGRHKHQMEFMFSCKLPDEVECKFGLGPDIGQIAIEWLPLAQLSEYNLWPHAIIPLLMNGHGHSSIYLGSVN